MWFSNPGWRSYPNHAALDGSAGGGTDAATTAWVNAVVAAGGTVSGTQQTRVNTLIVALKAHGIFSQLDRLWLWAGESVHQQAKIDIINLGVATEHGNLTTTGLTASGYVGDGSTGYFDSGFGPATGPNGTDASAMFGCYITSARASGGGQQSGVQDSFIEQLSPYNFGNTQWQINNAFIQVATTSANGLWAGTQLSNTITVYNFSTTNGASGSIGTAANASPHISANNIFFSGFNSSGTPSNFSTDTHAAGYLGSGGINVATFATDLNAYMTAWGVNQF